MLLRADEATRVAVDGRGGHKDEIFGGEALNGGWLRCGRREAHDGVWREPVVIKMEGDDAAILLPRGPSIDVSVCLLVYDAPVGNIRLEHDEEAAVVSRVRRAIHLNGIDVPGAE